MAALDALEKSGILPVAVSRIWQTAPMGPSQRRFANAVAVVETVLEPDALLRALKAIERGFGRRRGRRWGERVLDIDIALWSGGCWASRRPDLIVPHTGLHVRDFLLGPACEIAGDWRDPVSGLSVRQMTVRNARHGAGLGGVQGRVSAKQAKRLTEGRSPTRWGA